MMGMAVRRPIRLNLSIFLLVSFTVSSAWNLRHRNHHRHHCRGQSSRKARGGQRWIKRRKIVNFLSRSTTLSRRIMSIAPQQLSYKDSLSSDKLRQQLQEQSQEPYDFQAIIFDIDGT